MQFQRWFKIPIVVINSTFTIYWTVNRLTQIKKNKMYVSLVVQKY